MPLWSKRTFCLELPMYEYHEDENDDTSQRSGSASGQRKGDEGGHEGDHQESDEGGHQGSDEGSAPHQGETPRQPSRTVINAV